MAQVEANFVFRSVSGPKTSKQACCDLAHSRNMKVKYEFIFHQALSSLPPSSLLNLSCCRGYKLKTILLTGEMVKISTTHQKDAWGDFDCLQSINRAILRKPIFLIKLIWLSTPVRGPYVCKWKSLDQNFPNTEGTLYFNKHKICVLGQVAGFI